MGAAVICGGNAHRDPRGGMGAQGRAKKLLYNLNTDVGILGKELSNLKKEIK